MRKQSLFLKSIRDDKLRVMSIAPKTYTVKTLEETRVVAKDLASQLQPGDIVCFSGDLGAGKTTLIRFLCEAWAVVDYVNSPTFTIINEYQSPQFKINHMDFYRLNSTEDLFEIGFETYLNGEDVTLIEWAELFPDLLPDNRWLVNLTHVDSAGSRSILISKH
jgi:tRNA threonylcarbamoyladenosine biosynthesis protein TsaE